MKYKVIWEVSKYAYIEAENETEAIEKLMTGEEKEFENEITMTPEVCKTY